MSVVGVSLLLGGSNHASRFGLVEVFAAVQQGSISCDLAFEVRGGVHLQFRKPGRFGRFLLKWRSSAIPVKWGVGLTWLGVAFRFVISMCLVVQDLNFDSGGGSYHRSMRRGLGFDGA